MAAGLQGGTVLVFSTGSVGDETYGVVQNYSINETTERAEAKGPNGHTVSVQEYDDKKELSLNYLVKGTQTGEPAIGTTFTFLSDTWYVSSINSTNTVDGFKTVDVTATNYPNLGT